MATFEFWRQFEETAKSMPAASKGAFFQVYVTLQKVLVKQCHWITDKYFDMEIIKKADLSEELEIFIDYREEVKEVFITCFRLLNYDYFANLGEMLSSLANSQVFYHCPSSPSPPPFLSGVFN